jgi:dTDP-4-dehydrorhamnose reductase
LKYIVLGAYGQLGRDLCPRLEGVVIPTTRAEADLSEPDSLGATLRRHQPDVVINCAAYNYVDRAEQEPNAALAANALGPRELARICRDLSCLLVHFSSDYVYGLDASRRLPYVETDAPGPLSVYGLSKLAGEYLVRSIAPQHLVIRTFGLYGVWGSGGKGGNFVETMLRLSAQGKPLRVVADQTCTPSYTADVASATCQLIRNNARGIFHVTNAGACSWFELAQTVFELASIPAQLTPITSEEFGAPARRPRYSVLSCDLCRSIGLPPLRNWREALAAYLEERACRASAG